MTCERDKHLAPSETAVQSVHVRGLSRGGLRGEMDVLGGIVVLNDRVELRLQVDERIESRTTLAHLDESEGKTMRSRYQSLGR